MEFMRLLLTAGLILIAARIGLTDENSENNSDLIVKDRLPNYIKPKHYDIKMEIKRNGDNVVITSICDISISVEIPIQNISLHAHRQHIQILETNLYLDQKASDELQNYTYNNESHILTFHLNNKIPRGLYNLKITFTSFGFNNGEGIFKTSYANEEGDKKLLAVTNFYPIGARRVFPCWDEPAIKAIFKFSIKYHHKNLLTFGPTPSLSIYQIAFMLRDFGVLVRGVWCRRSTLPVNLADSIFKKTALLGKEWGFHYLTNVVNIAIPGFQYDSTGYRGLTFYRETAIIYDDKIDPVGHKINVACLIAREAARQWFSEISPSWWSHSWLNEGIARLLGLDAIHEIFPDYGRLSIVQIKQESLRLDTQSIMKPLISQINSPSEINSMFSFSYYIKGPVILQMLQHLLTNEVFQKGLHNYLNRHKYDSASVDDFWTAMQDALDKKPSVKKLFLKEKFHAWTYRPHYPVLNIIQNPEYEADSGQILALWQENINGTNWSEWWLPVTYATQTSPFFSLDTAAWLSTFSKGKAALHVATEDWIIANKQQIGYYRVNYDVQNWLRIAEILNSENYSKIHVLNRAQIIDDAYHFFITRKLDVIIFMELARYLKQETDFVAWYPMIKAFEDLSSCFPFHQESEYIKGNMRTILDGLLEKIGYEEITTNNDISDSLRQEAAKWACVMGSYGCMKAANLKLRLLFERKSTLLPYWKHWTYCNGLVDNSTWLKMFNTYRQEYGSTILKFVACSENVIMICNYLRTSENYNELRDIDRINIFHSIVARHANNIFILDYISTNFEKIKPKKVSTTALLINIINHIHSKELLVKLYKKISVFMEYLLLGKKKETIIDKFLYTFLKFLNEEIWFKFNKDNGDMIKRNKKLISFVARKIEMRLSQINSQINI